MSKRQAQMLAKKFNGKIYENYSGRWMFGQTTYGVEIDRYTFCCEYRNSRHARHYRSDSLGLDYIVY